MNVKLDVPTSFIIRNVPSARYSFLRCQAGLVSTRPEQVPLYIGHAVVGYRAGEPVAVFSLFGFGETEEAALAMAHRTPPYQ